MYNILAIDNNAEKLSAAHEEWKKLNANLSYVDTAQNLLNELSHKEYSLVILVAEYLDGDLIPTLKMLRSASSLPILILTTDYCPYTQAETLTLGADMYISKPETIKESAMYGMALIRRHTDLNNRRKRAFTTIMHGDILLCVEYRTVFVGGKEIHLSKREYDLFHLFMSNPKRVYTYSYLYDRLYGDDGGGGDVKHVIFSLIKRLRKKLKVKSDDPDYIKSKHDLGYCFE